MVRGEKLAINLRLPGGLLFAALNHPGGRIFFKEVPMFKVIASATICAALAMCCNAFISPANAACDKARAEEMLAVVEESFADRDFVPERSFVWYEWRTGWDSLSPGQKRRMTNGIGIMERCLSGKETRIRYAGKDVGYYNAKGAVEIYD